MKISLTACVVNSRGKYPAPDKKEKRKGTGLLRETRLCRLRGLRRQPEEGSPRYGKFTGRSPASVSTQGRPLAPGAPPEMPPARGSRSAHQGLTGSRAERHRAGHGRKKDSTGSRGAGVYPAGSGKTQRQPFNSRKFLRAASCGTAEGQAKSKEVCGAWRMTGYSVRRGTWPRFCGLW